MRQQDAEVFFERALATALKLWVEGDLALTTYFEAFAESTYPAIRITHPGDGKTFTLSIKAMEHLKTALKIKKEAKYVPPAEWAKSAALVARSRYIFGEYLEAFEHYGVALKVYGDVYSARNPKLAGLAVEMAATGMKLDKPDFVLKTLEFANGVERGSRSLDDPARIYSTMSLAEQLARESQDLPKARSLFREAEEGLLARVKIYPDFGPDAQDEMRRNRYIFTGQVAVAWKLAEAQ